MQVDLEEPNYPGNGTDKVTNIVPNQVIAKDPKVENTGKNTAIVFTSVSIGWHNMEAKKEKRTEGGWKECLIIRKLEK